MPIVRLNIPVYLPMALYRPLRRLKRAITDRNRPTRNLWGDRDVEYSFIAAHMPNGPGKALDFGSGSSYMSLLAALRGFEVIALVWSPKLSLGGTLRCVSFKETCLNWICPPTTLTSSSTVQRWNMSGWWGDTV
jgi:hypothetical protein